MKPANLLCRLFPSWIRPSWDECVHASCWTGSNAAVRLMNILSPHCSDGSFDNWVDWMKKRGCDTAHLFLSNKADGVWAGYSPYGSDPGAPWDWKPDTSVCRHMRARMRSMRRRGIAVVVWLFADDSAVWNREAAKDFPRYLRDLSDNGLLDYASTIVAGLEADEYFTAAQVKALVNAVRTVYRGKVGVHQTSGRMDYAPLADIFFGQVKPETSLAGIAAAVARFRAAGRPVNLFECRRQEDRAASQEALAAGAYGVGNW
jgi:hypothetical protein